MKFVGSTRKRVAREETLGFQKQNFITMDTPTGVATALRHVDFLSKATGFIVGDGGVILKYNEDRGEFDEDSQSKSITTQDLGGVMTAPGTIQARAVGDEFTILNWDGSTWSADSKSGHDTDINFMDLIHYDDGTYEFAIVVGWDSTNDTGVVWRYGLPVATAEGWTKTLDADNILYAISGTSYPELIVAGYNGSCFFSENNGQGWTKIATGTTEDIYGIGAVASGDYWLFGTNGWIGHYEDGVVTEVPSPTSDHLFDGWFFNEDSGWAFGGSGTVLRWDGEYWKKFPTPTNYSIQNAYAVDENFLLVCGAYGYIGHLYGKAWPTPLMDKKGAVLDYRIPTIETVLSAEAIRDTADHDTDVYSMMLNSHCSIKVDSTLDQDVTAQVYGNTVDSKTGAVTIGSSFTVASGGDQQIRSVNVDNAGWYPYMFVRLSCSVAPTSGDVDVTVGKKPME